MRNARPRKQTPKQTRLPLALAATLVLAWTSVGCVEMSRKETKRYGAPTHYMSGPPREFDANNYEPYKAEPKPWYERLIFW